MKPPSSELLRKRTRISTPRVKTGCGNCRKRHIKCDETRPSCTRCGRAGWKCDGYPSQTSAENDSTKLILQQAAAVSAASLNIASYSLPFRIPGSQQDRQLLHYFCVQASSDISGLLSSRFWSHTILQNSHHEPVVRQALVALSSLHLDLTTSASRGTQLAPGPLQSHGKALRMLNRRLSSGGSEAVKVALLCCVLFFCFESTVGNSAAALQHLGKGLGILSSDLMRRCTAEDVESISNVFMRLDLQATMFDDERLPFLVLVSPEEKRVGIIKDPEIPFKTLEEAQKELDRLQNWLLHLIISTTQYRDQPVEAIPKDVLQERNLLVTEYDRWLLKFSLAANNPSQVDQLCGIQTLLLHHKITQMLLAARLPDDETVFTASPNPAAREALDLAENIVTQLQKKNAAAETAKNPRRSLASDTGIIAPLTMLAVKCADEDIHTRATQLLATCQRQEGLYDARSMVAVVQDLEKVKQQRLLAARLEGVEDATPRSLQYWTADIIDGAHNDLVARESSTPRTILHPLIPASDGSSS